MVMVMMVIITGIMVIDHDAGDSWDSNDGAHDDEYASDLPASVITDAT